MQRTPPERPAFAARPVLLAAGVLLVLLLVTAPAYGYERDELYFRMLPPAWAYPDQPALTPLIVHGISLLLDEPAAFRIVAAVIAAAAVPLCALIPREAGGGRLAQTVAAWGTGFGAFSLVLGHSFLTGTIDLLVWPAVLLGVMRAVLRSDGRWWLFAGAVAGLGTSNKLLIAFLLVGIAAGLVAVGPRSWFRSGWLWGAVALAVALAAPQLAYQLTNGLPQVRMGEALGAGRGPLELLLVVPFLAVLLSPVAVPVWGAGLVAPFRRPDWRALRFVPVAFGTVVAISVVGGGQPYYPLGALVGVFALGSVPVEAWARTRKRRRIVVILTASSTVVSCVISLPVIPIGSLAGTPVPAINQAVDDQIGWPELAAAVDRAGRGHPDAVVLASNFGEAGAVARFSTRFADRVVSGHNGLADLPVPVTDATTVITVGDQQPRVRAVLIRCRVVARVENDAGIGNEERSAPIAVCAYPGGSVRDLVERARYLG